jgi:alpha-L-fucosidase
VHLWYRVAVKVTPSLFVLALAFSQVMLAQQAVSPSQRQKQRIARQVARVRALTSPTSGTRAPFIATWDSLSAYRAPDWFRDAKFGIFLHWGVFSVPAFGNEWYSRDMYVPGDKAFQHHIAIYGPQSTFGYKDFIDRFRAEKFSAASWVDLFAQAGARYIVPVGEHCDGFSMYASSINPWNAAAMGPHRDIVGELATATRAMGLHFGISSHTAEHWWWYGAGRTFDSDVRSMSTIGNNNSPPTDELYGPAASMEIPTAGQSPDLTKQPDPNHLERWLPPNESFLEEWLAKSTEIVDRYHPDLMYFDWWAGQPAFMSVLQQFAAYFYDRSAERHQRPVLTYKLEAMPPNTATLDIERGKMDTLRLLPWQTDTSISIHSWGYVEHDEYRSAKSLIHQLVDTVSKNGNLLLNVGPKADGTIPGEARTILLSMGEWLHLNGEAIYGSRPFTVFGEGPTKGGTKSVEMNNDIQTYTAEDVRFTTNRSASGESVLYATLLVWPKDGDIIIHTLFAENPYLLGPVCAVELIGSNDSLQFHQSQAGLHMTLPKTAEAAGLGDIAYVLRIHSSCNEHGKPHRTGKGPLLTGSLKLLNQKPKYPAIGGPLEENNAGASADLKN